MSKWIVKVKLHDDETTKEVIFVFDGLDKYEVGGTLFNSMMRLGFVKEDYAAEYKEFPQDGTSQSNG